MKMCNNCRTKILNGQSTCPKCRKPVLENNDVEMQNYKITFISEDSDITSIKLTQQEAELFAWILNEVQIGISRNCGCVKIDIEHPV